MPEINNVQRVSTLDSDVELIGRKPGANGSLAVLIRIPQNLVGSGSGTPVDNDLFDEANIKTNYTSTFNRVNGVLVSILYSRSTESYLKVFVRESGVLTSIKWYSGSVEDTDNLLLTKTLTRSNGTLVGITVS